MRNNYIIQSHALPTDSVPNIINTSGSPDTPTSIRISWGFPQQDCYTFASHQVSCYIDEQLASSSAVLPGGTTNHGVVDALAVDTLYNCSVSSNVTVGGVAQSVRSTTVLTFTYPNGEYCIVNNIIAVYYTNCNYSFSFGCPISTTV